MPELQDCTELLVPLRRAYHWQTFWRLAAAVWITPWCGALLYCLLDKQYKLWVPGWIPTLGFIGAVAYSTWRCRAARKKWMAQVATQQPAQT